MANLAKLNKPESKSSILRRLRREIVLRQRGPVRLPSAIEALEFRREQYGLTAREFSRLLGMAHTHYSECVHGKRRVPLEVRYSAYAIGVPAEVLLQPD